jgi:hypothetical protein
MPRKRPKPDPRFIRVWYSALREPVEMAAADMKVAIRIRWLLNTAKQADKELYMAQHGDARAEGWPLEYMTTVITQHESEYTVTIKRDAAIIGALTSAGVITEPTPIDIAAVTAECELRLVKYAEADFFKRARTGQLTPDDIFPVEE